MLRCPFAYVPSSNNPKKQNRRWKTFVERVLPVDSVEEYFEHFPVLEIDFPFYRPLLDNDSQPDLPPQN
jgi:hypothetical protein